jgi:hypothetical protein
MINLIFFTSCRQNEVPIKKEATTAEQEQSRESKFKTIHPYGGWSCPDNLRVFPAVDIQKLDEVPVVMGRLPTKEETQNGTSLMFFDTTLIPAARPLDMTLPKLARYYSTYTKKNELIIVIQAVVVEQDTVVGFRYVNGGNGSAWFGEVNFISDEEIDELGNTPFVSFDSEIKASPEKIWEVITSPTNAKTLGEVFDKNAFVESDWKMDSEVHFKYEPDSIVNTGIVTASWENLYIQVDYNFDGYHYVEKFLILKNNQYRLLEDNNTPKTQLQIVSGPYGEDFEAQKVVWNNWLQKVKELSEGG